MHRVLVICSCIGLFFIQESSSAYVEVVPSERLVLPGQNATFMCRVGVPLQYCRVEIPGRKALNLNAKLSNSEVRYYGQGLNAGQCGFVINNVDDRNNGLIKCTLGIETESQESVGTMQLIVARAPKPPELDLSRGTDSLRVYKIGDMVQASCVVRDGRPVANISWFLEDEQLYRDGLSMPSIFDLAKENLQTIVQNLTRHLVASDNGKRLRCVAEHPAYPNGRSEISRQLDVKYEPQPQQDPIERFGYTIGQAGTISVEIEANPKPKIHWDVDGERIMEGQTDQTGRIEAEAARELGNGRYEVNLKIAAISKQDTERQYVLAAYNDMGTQFYHVKISTSPEPEGLDVGIGSIIGIVIAICIILLITFLVIFAKVTGRWCFSGSSSERPLGESSDTESAEERSRDSKFHLTNVKLTSFFKRNKDKVAAEGADEPREIDTEEIKVPIDTDLKESTPTPSVEASGGKEGIVYAELDLVNPNVKPVVKNDDEKTEYAEIIYTPKESDKPVANKKE